MREIKFRVWDRTTNKMVIPARLFTSMDGTIWSADLGNRYTNAVVEPGLTGILMQYTGLKDKNGKEIYEGDILEYEKLSFRDDGHERGFVEYNEYAEWSVNNWLLNRIYRRAEVIGNRFENPELLEEQNV
jgi:uncharacterized phage protein (TIGR01671 family)